MTPADVVRDALAEAVRETLAKLWATPSVEPHPSRPGKLRGATFLLVAVRPAQRRAVTVPSTANSCPST
ncbi:hypothetical protein [Streptomyces sp. NPDC001530]|uniref:hypothetical protein n=1 Tax=Streptomyces sp. NPDC001530 TaxID=3364582 RepID=UPI003673B68C